MKTYTGCIESQITHLIREAFESVIDAKQADTALEQLKEHLSISVSFNTIEVSIYCNYFTALFLATRLEKEGFVFKGYETDIERISLVRSI